MLNYMYYFCIIVNSHMLCIHTSHVLLKIIFYHKYSHDILYVNKYSLSFSHTTTKKRGYPSVFKTAGTAPKSAGIGSKFLSRRFFSRRFKPLGNECGYRVSRPVPALFKSAGKGIRPIPALLKALV